MIKTFKTKTFTKMIAFLLVLAVFSPFVPTNLMAIDLGYDDLGQPDYGYADDKEYPEDNEYDYEYDYEKKYPEEELIYGADTYAVPLTEIIVATEDELRAAVSGSGGIPTTIIVNNTISLTNPAPVSNAINIPSGYEITITGSGRIETFNVSRHFRVNGVLNLSGDIVLTRAGGGAAGGIAVAPGGVLNIYDNASIYNNMITTMSQPVFVSWGSGVVLEGSNITGGGGTLNMHGGEIRDNTAVNGPGGGVAIMMNATFNMYRGTISGNSSDRSGMDAGNGGGVALISHYSRFNMYGGTIIGNTTTGDGGGVHISLSGNNARFYMHPGAQIIGNTAGSGGAEYHGGGVHLDNGTFTMYGGWIYDNEAHGQGGGVAVLAGGPDSITRFYMRSPGGIIENNNARNGGGVIVALTAAFTMYDGLITLNEAAGDGGGVLGWNGGLPAGFPVGHFTMRGGRIIDNEAISNGGGVAIWEHTSNGFRFYMEDGIISDNDAGVNGGGVYLRSNITFGMDDGEISDNEADMHGGGVYVGYNSEFDMADGRIDDNTANYGGGVYVVTEGRFEASAGSIINNHALYDGGGVFTENYYYDSPLPDNGEYGNLEITDSVIFNGNTAGNGSFPPPINWYITDIRGASVSPEAVEHPLNNYDVNFRANFAAMSITKTAAPTSVSPGGTVRYTLLIENTGTMELTDLLVTDPLHGLISNPIVESLPEGVTQQETVGTTISFIIASLEPGESISISFTVTVATSAGVGSVIPNVATLRSEEHDLTDTDDAEVTVTAPGGGGGGGGGGTPGTNPPWVSNPRPPASTPVPEREPGAIIVEDPIVNIQTPPYPYFPNNVEELDTLDVEIETEETTEQTTTRKNPQTGDIRRNMNGLYVVLIVLSLGVLNLSFVKRRDA